MQTTGFVLFVLCLVALVWDIYALAEGGLGATESNFIYTLCRHYPTTVYLLGILSGHLLTNMMRSK